MTKKRDGNPVSDAVDEVAEQLQTQVLELLQQVVGSSELKASVQKHADEIERLLIMARTQ